jgi:hypothetical protein
MTKYYDAMVVDLNRMNVEGEGHSILEVSLQHISGSNEGCCTDLIQESQFAIL